MKSIRDLISECRKHGTTNGACVGYHNELFDEVADRLEGLVRREEDIKAEAYKEVFKSLETKVYLNILPGSVVISKQDYAFIKQSFGGEEKNDNSHD